MAGEDQSQARWDSFDDGALEFLAVESRQRLRESLEIRGQQDRTGLYLIGWTVTLVGAAGIFGDLRISDLDAVSALSALAALSTLGVGIAAALMFKPRSWAAGVDVEALSQVAGASVRQLREIALEASVRGFAVNTRHTNGRERVLNWLYRLAVLTSVLIVVMQLLAVLSR